jgi:lipid II:glycine glycyltransferase (peptidoglycan interpeptide bridge formation enzyme)
MDMRFSEVSEADFRVFCQTAPGANYAQSVEMARLRQSLGYEVGYYGVLKGGELKLAGLVGWKGHAGDCYGGPVGDLGTLPAWTTGLKATARVRGVHTVYMNPIRTAERRDNAWQVLEKTAWPELRRSGWRLVTAITPYWVYVKPLDYVDEAALRSSLRQNARTGVNRATREGVTVRELRRDELPIFADLMGQTARRQGFVERGLGYYEQLFDAFRGDYRARFTVAEVDEKAVFAGCFIEGGLETVYLFGGNAEGEMARQGNYLAVWQEMRAALVAGGKEFNFYGFSGRPEDKLLTFKKNWNGEVRRYVGRFALAVDGMGRLKLWLQWLSGKIKR